MLEQTEQFILSRLRDTKDLANSYTSDGKYKRRYLYYRLKMYAEDFIRYPERQERWIIVYGLRGIGKTTLLMQIYKYFIEELHLDRNNLLYLPADNLISYTSGNLAEAIITYFEKIKKTSIAALKEKVVILVDEAHYDKKWETTIKSMYDQSKNIFIIVTGSSAIALNLTTDTTRRSIKEALFPLNFAEYEMITNSIFPSKDMTSDLKKLILNKDLSSLSSVQEKEQNLRTKYESKGIKSKTEIESFLQFGGFATSNITQRVIYYKQVIETIRKIINTDIPLIRSFATDTQIDILRIVGYFALKKPGETSIAKIAKSLELSPTLVKSILEALEMSHLIFSIKPHSRSAGAWAGAAWKYYFISSTLLCALRSNLGYDIMGDDNKGIVYETAVASSLFRFGETSTTPISILYDLEPKKNVDFLIRNNLSSKIIPIEVGVNKDNVQITDAIQRLNCEYGIVITDTDKTHFEGNILKIPFSTFFLL